jgi:16S rRNA (guanine527-N7)-methyltransferase
VLPYIRGMRVLDVGSGAGLPGIPLAIVKPDWRYTLLDKQGKKTRFMVQAAAELGLQQVEVIQSAVEAFTPDAPFDTVVARAFSSLYHMVDSCGRLCAPQGRLLAMKGKPAPEELNTLPPGYRCIEDLQLQVPGLNAARSLVLVAPVGS